MFMKNAVKSSAAVFMSVVVLLCFAACGNKVSKEGLWNSADYLKDTEFGKGSTVVQVEVKAEEQSVTFTVKTDKDNLGDALLEYNLIDGDESDYGLYVKKVNGITADYDADKSYWAFYKDGQYMSTGVDSTKIADGEHYELVYTK